MPDLYSWPSLGFVVFVIVVLVLDLAVFHRENKEIRIREAALWTGNVNLRRPGRLEARQTHTGFPRH